MSIEEIAIALYAAYTENTLASLYLPRWEKEHPFVRESFLRCGKWVSEHAGEINKEVTDG